MDGAADPAVDLAAIKALIGRAEQADRIEPLSEHSLLHLERGGGQDLVERSDAGPVVGYAHLDVGEDGTATGELVVDPKARRNGHGTSLIRRLEAAAGTAVLRVWAHGQLPEAVALAESLGYRMVRELWQMRRALDRPDAEPLPEQRELDGLRLRTFRVGQDEEAWLRVNARAFSAHPDQGGWDASDLSDREHADWFDPDGFLLAEDVSGDAADGHGALAGFHWTKQHRGEGEPPIGEVYVLGVDPAYQGRGLGPALTLAGLHYLRAQGLPEVMLYVDGDNAPAIATYRRLGFHRSRLDVVYAPAADV